MCEALTPLEAALYSSVVRAFCTLWYKIWGLIAHEAQNKFEILNETTVA